MSRYTRWYRDGTGNFTNGSTEVTGSGTYWETAGINPGDLLEVDNSGIFYEIASINSDTSITLARAYQGNTVTDSAYAVVRNFTATMPSKIAAQTAELIGDFRKYVDTDMDRLTGRSAYETAVQNGYVGTTAQWLESLKGKSAYQLAVANGYVGTLDEWLESLKGAGDYSELLKVVEPLNYHSAEAHNAFCRGKNLGELDSSMLTAIKDGTFKDLYPGDYGTLSGLQCKILGLNSWKYLGLSKNHALIEFVAWGMYPDIGNRMHSSTLCSEGLVGCEMYTYVMPDVLSKIEAVFGADNVLSIRTRIADAMSGSSVNNCRYTNYSAYDAKIVNMNRGMLFGDISDVSYFSSTLNTAYPDIKYQVPYYRHNMGSSSLMWSDMVGFRFVNSSFYAYPQGATASSGYQFVVAIG